MRWNKRLKWVRLSKVIIPIALAISLIFAGFTVYANQAENFVIRIDNTSDANLSLCMDRDLTRLTTTLIVPVDCGYEDVTYQPDPELKYASSKYLTNLPDDIAQQEGIHSVYAWSKGLAFYSFSFYLVNSSSRAVDVDISMTVDQVTYADNSSDLHVDDAVRVMFIEGEPLLSEGTYTVYQKPNREYDESTPEGLYKAEEDRSYLSSIEYTNVKEFKSSTCVFELKDDEGITDFEPYSRDEETGEVRGVRRFTVVLWLEGWDPECKDEIMSDSLKLSLNFQGR